MDGFIAIGQIINTHGIKGEVKVYPLTDDINRYKILKEAYIDGELIKVTECKFLKDKVVLKIDNIDSIEEATKYKNKYISVKKEEAIKLPKDRYFIVDLIGCKVVQETGEELGILSEVIKTGSNDVYVVKGKKETLVPALKDIVINIDIDNKLILIRPTKVWNYED